MRSILCSQASGAAIKYSNICWLTYSRSNITLLDAPVPKAPASSNGYKFSSEGKDSLYQAVKKAFEDDPPAPIPPYVRKKRTKEERREYNMTLYGTPHRKCPEALTTTQNHSSLHLLVRPTPWWWVLEMAAEWGQWWVGLRTGLGRLLLPLSKMVWGEWRWRLEV